MAAVNSRQTLKDDWTPRWYYIMKNRTSGKMYLGQTTQNIETYRGSGSYWKPHCKKHGGYNRENIDVVNSWWFDDKEFAELFLLEFESKEGQYWLEENTKWANLVKEDTLENPFYNNGSSISKKQNARSIADGSHPWLKQNRTSDISKTEFTSKSAKEFNDQLINNRKHQFLKENETEKLRKQREEFGTRANKLMLERGTHASQNAESCKKIGEKNKINNKNQVDSGLHQFLNGFYAVNKNGEIVKVSKKQYKTQVGEKSDWEFVHPTSNEGKRRRGVK